MSNSWPIEMSKLINDCVGPMQTAAQIARDWEIECEAHGNMIELLDEMDTLRSRWREIDEVYVRGFGRPRDRCIEPSFARMNVG